MAKVFGMHMIGLRSPTTTALQRGGSLLRRRHWLSPGLEAFTDLFKGDAPSSPKQQGWWLSREP
jgi:hypothetical protein